jgi:hypothetical protein
MKEKPNAANTQGTDRAITSAGIPAPGRQGWAGRDRRVPGPNQLRPRPSDASRAPGLPPRRPPCQGARARRRPGGAAEGHGPAWTTVPEPGRPLEGGAQAAPAPPQQLQRMWHAAAAGGGPSQPSEPSEPSVLRLSPERRQAARRLRRPWRRRPRAAAGATSARQLEPPEQPTLATHDCDGCGGLGVCGGASGRGSEWRVRGDRPSYLLQQKTRRPGESGCGPRGHRMLATAGGWLVLRPRGTLCLPASLVAHSPSGAASQPPMPPRRPKNVFHSALSFLLLFGDVFACFKACVGLFGNGNYVIFHPRLSQNNGCPIRAGQNN